MKNEGRLLNTPNSLTTLGKPLLAAWKGNMNSFSTDFSACIYLPKVSNMNSITRCEIYSKLTIKTPERRLYCRSGVFFVNFEHICQLVLVFLLGWPKRRGPKIRLRITKIKGKF